MQPADKGRERWEGVQREVFNASGLEVVCEGVQTRPPQNVLLGA